MQILIAVLGDPLDGVSGRVMVPSQFSRVVGGRGRLSRDVSHFKMLASALRRMCRGRCPEDGQCETCL